MSLLIKIKGADFSGLGLPAVQQMVHGFPIDDLEGLYLLEDGIQDAVYSGPFTDSSGKDNHAIVRDTWIAPIKKQSGYQTNSEHGMIMETPIPANTSYSVICVARHTLPTDGSSTATPVFFSPADGLGASMSAYHRNDKGWILNVTLNNDTWGAYSVAAGYTRRPLVGSKGAVVTVIGITFDVDSGLMTIRNLAGTIGTLTNADVATEIKGLTGKVAFGCWKNADVTPVSGESHLFAYYNAVLTDANLLKAMNAAKARVEARGVAVS